MNLIVFALFGTAVFLLGHLILAVIIYLKHCDPNATYGLYAIRDRIIGASVFDGVPRNDPWLVPLYDGVNAVLRVSNIFAGPGEGWAIAKETGKWLAVRSESTDTDSVFPSTPPLEPLMPIVEDLMGALDHLINQHGGWVLLRVARTKEKLRIQKVKAKAEELKRALQESHVQLVPA